MNSYTKETALITGASSGIGLELAQLFAADGANLILVARSEDKLRLLADELKTQYEITIHVIPKDLADPNAPQEIYDELQAGNIAVDVLVNNAGVGALGPVAELDTRRQVNMVQVNVTALTHLTRLFLPEMIQRNRGGILNVGSTAGFQPGPNMTVYYASKAYVISFTEGLAEELTESDLHVTCLAPGATVTSFGDDSGMGRSRLFKMGAMSAQSVARAGYDGLRQGKVLVIPGFSNQASVFLTRFTPRSLTRKIVKSLQSES